jgi:hypothetical protein
MLVGTPVPVIPAQAEPSALACAVLLLLPLLWEQSNKGNDSGDRSPARALGPCLRRGDEE